IRAGMLTIADGSSSRPRTLTLTGAACEKTACYCGAGVHACSGSPDPPPSERQSAFPSTFNVGWLPPLSGASAAVGRLTIGRSLPSCPAEQRSRNQKRRPGRPQAEGLPHEESAQAAKILTSGNTKALCLAYRYAQIPAVCLMNRGSLHFLSRTQKTARSGAVRSRLTIYSCLMLNPAIFREYDIRGVADVELRDVDIVLLAVRS